MALELLEILNGIFSLIFVSVSIFIGIKIITKYFYFKRREFILMGVSWIGITSPWWGGSLSLIFSLILGEGLSLQLYLLVTITSLPLTIFLYLTAITDLVGKEKQRLILGLIFIIGLIFDIFYIFYSIADPNMLGVLESPIDITYKNFAVFYILFCLIAFILGGSVLAINSLKSDNQSVRLQGKFLFLAFISFFMGALLDAAVILTLFTLFLTRIVLISSAIEFYIGFILPSGVKNLFIK
ncbi:MAG: conserved membrane protein of unknown function [Promethearchaeota archaeon]|nr:MAG: conserved membrane protein of unknown function [Candidatus Lokiarchaeota archaeon]